MALAVGPYVMWRVSRAALLFEVPAGGYDHRLAARRRIQCRNLAA